MADKITFTQTDETVWQSDDWSYEIRLVGSMFNVYDVIEDDWLNDEDYPTFEAAAAAAQASFDRQVLTGER